MTVENDKYMREKQFRDAIQEILDRFEAELVITDDGKPYGLANPILRVEMPGNYDKETGDCIDEYTSFNW
mgnify:CR=1 FL=1